MRRLSIFSSLLCLMVGAPAVHAAQFGRCDFFNVGSSLIGMASAGVDDNGRPVLLFLQGGVSSRVISVVVDPAELAVACGFALNSVNISLDTFQPLALAVGDLNGDRRLDFALAGSDVLPERDVLIYLGSGAGQFTRDATNPYRRARDGANSVAIADVDRDGVADLVVGSGPDESVTVLYSGTVRAEPLPVQGVSPGSLAVGFLNNDGFPDIITGSVGRAKLTGLFQSPARQFSISASLDSVAPQSFTVADLDNDLIGDVLVVRDSAMRLEVYRGPLPNNLALLTASTSLLTGAGPSAVAAGDFTGDGEVDVVVANRDEGSVSLFVGNGRGGIAQNSLVAGCRLSNTEQRCPVAGNPIAVVAADAEGGPLDLDGDGIGDIAVVSENGALSLLLSAASSAIATPTRSPSPSVTPSPEPSATLTASATPTATIFTTDCCISHSSPSCEPNRENQESCSVCVCANDPHCCTAAWDEICVEFAKTTCTNACVCDGVPLPATPVPTETPTETPTITLTPTITETPTETPLISPTPTIPFTVTIPPPSTRTSTPTVTGTLPTATRTPSRTGTPSHTPTISPTSTVQACIGGGLCINGSGCNTGDGSDSTMLLLLGLVPALLLLARRCA